MRFVWRGTCRWRGRGKAYEIDVDGCVWVMYVRPMTMIAQDIIQT
jgi:hypothetical protein